MHRAPALLAAVLVAAGGLAPGCGGALGRSAPAAGSVRELVAALRADDPRRAYGLLSAETRRQVSFDDFALQWRQAAAERAWQAHALEAGLRGEPDVGEQALASFADGRSVVLEREGAAWRLESALVTQARSRRPRDAVRLFAEALADRDIPRLLRSLTARRRAGLEAQLAGFMEGLESRLDARIDEIGSDRAELRWDAGGAQYRLVLRKEEGEWRVDDIHIRTEEPGEDEGGDDGVIEFSP